MAQSKIQSEQGKSLPAYIKVQRIFFTVGIALGPLTHFVYVIFDPTGSTGRVSIAANAAANAATNQLHLAFGVVASFLLPIGYLDMALLVLRRMPWLGTISLLLALPGWTPFSGLVGLDALTYDMAQMGGGAQFAALWDRFNGNGVMVSYVVIYAISHLLSILLLGIALGRARIIPIWAATALILTVSHNFRGTEVIESKERESRASREKEQPGWNRARCCRPSSGPSKPLARCS